MKHVLLTLAALLAVAAAPIAAAQEAFELPAGAYVQATSGMAFPAAVGPFQRLTSGTRYSPDGTDESVGYHWSRKQGVVQATVYVYPSPSLANASAVQGGIDAARAELCSTQFSGVAREIAGVHPTATLTDNSAATLIQRGVSYAGRTLSFTVTSPSAFGKSHEPLRSQAYLFCYVGGRWTVKYRFTYPVALDVQEGIAAFMRDLAWTIAPEAL